MRVELEEQASGHESWVPRENVTRASRGNRLSSVFSCSSPSTYIKYVIALFESTL